jgi:SulP family sulfate permease
MLVTLTLTVFADLVVAVEVGVILAMLNFFRRMTAAVGVSVLEADEVAEHAPEQVPAFQDVLVYRVDGPFFFGAIEQFEAALLHTHTEPRAVIVSLEQVPFIDLTALASLEETLDRLRKRGVAVAICNAGDKVAERIVRTGAGRDLPVPPTASLSEAIAAVAADSAP